MVHDEFRFYNCIVINNDVLDMSVRLYEIGIRIPILV